MILRPENITKKIDSLGRVTLPKGLRDRMGIVEELEIYTMEYDDREFVCMAIPVNEEQEAKKKKWSLAVEALEELGLDVAEKLRDKM